MDLRYSDSAKYLGITLDSKLNFAGHIREKANKAKKGCFLRQNLQLGSYGVPHYVQCGGCTWQ